MTPPKPLNASPIRILSHHFTHISVEAAAGDNTDGGISLNTRRTSHQHSEDPRQWRVVLEINFGSKPGEPEAPYSGQLIIQGEFYVLQGYPEAKIPLLIDVTGASILFGACREMLANLTARSSHGMISLPSVSFVEKPPVPKKATTKKKSAQKK